jgi:ParB family chromosome partitioning protein
MARKNLLSGLMETNEEGQGASNAPAYPMRGASKSMIRSVSELARQADAYLEGEQVVDLDPEMIDGSFVADRLSEDQEHHQELLEAIRENGQNSPILVRPHPEREGRYMIVFGHRRVRVAKELGRKVRAVVKAIDDKAHVIAQGQENSARANLSFIEKAAFAKRLEDLGYTRDVICSALASNEAAVSKMITTVTRVPEDIIRAIGPAPAIGRERWIELSLLVPRRLEMASSVAATPEFSQLDSNARFEALHAALAAGSKPAHKAVTKSADTAWLPQDKKVSVRLKKAGKTATLAIGAADGPRFAEWISSNLSSLYEAFRKSEKTEQEH